MLKLPAGLLEATRLTRAGRLSEATALIQRALRGVRGASAGAVVPSGAPGGAVLDGEYRVVDAAQATLERPAADRAHERGRFIERTFANASGARRYKLYVPRRYDGQALPLVVMLHGCTQTPDDFAAGTRMNDVAEELGCFVLYPAQARSANAQRCWNWFNRGDQQREQGEPAVIAGMTEEVMRTYRIDPRRVYVAGLSAGGAMAAVMARTHPELYAAVCVHSGIAYAIAQDLPGAFAAMRGTAMPLRDAGSGTPIPPVPTIVFHGDEDDVVHPCNADHVVAQSAASHALERSAPSDAIPGGIVSQGSVPGGHRYTCTSYRDASGRTVLENWTIHGGGHAWSGGSPNGSFTDQRGPDATREMMRFFEAARTPAMRQ